MSARMDPAQAERETTGLFTKFTVDLTEELTLETEKDFLYISDPETYELYYISIAPGRPVPEEWKDCIGKKCYEALQRRDAPCPFCTNHLLKTEKYYIWEHFNEITGKNYILKDKLIDWHGKRARLEVVMDITGAERAKCVLMNALESQGVLMNCVEALVSESGAETALRRILGIIGEFYCAGWTHLFDFTSRNAPPLLVRPSRDTLAAWAEIFSNGRQAVVRDTAALRESDPALYQRLRQNGVRSACFTPLFIKGRMTGMLCLYNISAHWEELYLLKTLAKYVGGELHKGVMEAENRRIMYFDSVTGYQNFEGFRRQAAEILERNPDAPYTLWYCDLRNFKYINDVFGYDVGNRILRFWADRIAEKMEEGETFARISADNFTALRHYRGVEHVKSMFDSFADRLAGFAETAQRRFRLEMVSGVYLMGTPEERLSLDEMLNRANIAQKSVKNKTGSQVALYSDEMRARVLYEMEMQNEMREALGRGEFILYFQPQAALTREGREGPDYAEALVRWKKEDGKIIMPGDFVDLFERNGMIVELDLYVFEHACRYLCGLRDRRGRALCLAVNVSRLSMLQPNFVESYCAIKTQYGIRPGEIELEFTESIAVENYERFREIIQALRDNGFSCAMDDFGTGQSSLNVLRKLPICVLKLDKQFFDPTDDPARGWAVISCVLALADRLHMDTVAEGIESLEQAQELREMGCKYIQGYIFSKPLPVDVFEKFDWLPAEKL